MYNNADLHSHTNLSDGTLSPSELVTLAKNNKVDILGVTDHDTTAGINEAILKGKELNVKVIPGIELSTLHNNESIHILGYFKDDTYKNKDFQGFLQEMIDYRMYRANKIVENLEKYFNIILDNNDVLSSGKGSIARPHIARAIINKGYPYDYEYIFENILSKNSPAYFPNKKISTEDGINLLKNVNAIVVLAHPILIKKSPVEELLKFDFDGVEAIYVQNKKEDTNKFISLSKEYNKFITAGSDFHTLDPSDTKHKTVGYMQLKDDNLITFLEEMKKV